MERRAEAVALCHEKLRGGAGLSWESAARLGLALLATVGTVGACQVLCCSSPSVRSPLQCISPWSHLQIPALQWERDG